MAWFRVRLTEEEQRVVNEERCCHRQPPHPRKMLVLWLLHTGLTRQQAAKAAGVRSGHPSSGTWPRFGRGAIGRPAAVGISVAR